MNVYMATMGQSVSTSAVEEAALLVIFMVPVTRCLGIARVMMSSQRILTARTATQVGPRLTALWPLTW